MRSRIILISVGSLLATLLAGCGGPSDTAEDDETLRIAAAFYPIAYAAERIASGARVENLTPAGAEPHDLELSARDVEAVGDADQVFYLGAGFMPALEDIVAGRPNAVDLLEGQELAREHAERGGGEADPHVWLDPIRYAAMASAMAASIGEPEAADTLDAELADLDGEFRSGLEDCDRREIVTSHAAFGYLVDAYDLRQVALAGVSPEAEPSPRALEQLVEEVEATGATTVFYESLVSPRVAETVAREAGAETAELNPLEGLTEDELNEGADYFTVMRANLDTLRTALACR